MILQNTEVHHGNEIGFDILLTNINFSANKSNKNYKLILIDGEL